MARQSRIARKTPLKRSGRIKAKRKYVWKPRSRKTKTRRILYGQAYTELRKHRASIANEHCEDCGKFAFFWSGQGRPWGAGELAHLDRGAKRNSVIGRVRWLCRKCHDKLDGRDIKPCPKK